MYQLGKFAFSYRMSVSEHWLGDHTAMAHAETPNGTLESPAIPFIVRLIPTTLALTVAPQVLAPAERVTITGRLVDVWGTPIPSGACNLTVDDETHSFVTDQAGAFRWSALGSEVGFGDHLANSSYHAEMPYLSSQSGIEGFTVNIPTSIELIVLNERVLLGNYLLGAGTLFANGSEPLDGQVVALSVDGRRTNNLTTGSAGTFAFSIDTSDIESGSHILKAEFLNRTVVFRYCSNSSTFTVYVRGTSGYPFWPIIPGWGDLGPMDSIPDLFFGRTGYIAWLVVIAMVVAVVKAAQRRNAAMALRKVEGEEAMRTGLSKIPADEWEPGAARAEAKLEARPPDDPNAKVVWMYNNLLQFLAGKRRVTIMDNMTHWEIARFLKMIGYPTRAVERLTQLFEKAFYSGSEISEDEVERMSDLSEEIKVAERRVEPLAT